MGLEFGPYPSVTPLNPRFLPGVPRMKVTLDVRPAPEGLHPARRDAAWMLGELRLLLPALSRHTCCDGGEIVAGLRGEADDLAHLLEHLVIDFQHSITSMRSCSGVTCGLVSPPGRYDVFVEAPDRRVARLCVLLARDLINGMLRGAQADPSYAGAADLAALFHRHPASALPVCTIRRLMAGGGDAVTALSVLRGYRFIEEVRVPLNFSGAALYALTGECPAEP